ncbi:MAG: efflux RND transporter periplasmic adaptor subunit [Deltaproteobacteria bacterium]|nr:efflux RND transporter periplasmic adaptor subunit [Deltaproteobacteria bacterium]
MSDRPRGPRKKGRLLALLLLVLVAGAILYKVTRLEAVKVARVARGTAIEAVYAVGTVEPVDVANLKARVSGPVLRLLVKEGDPVKAGQLLAEIDAPGLAFDVERGQADFRAARSRASSAPQLEMLRSNEKALTSELAQARRDLERVRRLSQSGVLSPQELERARTQVQTNEARLAANRAQQRDTQIAMRSDVDRAKAGVASLRARANERDLRAPLDGQVLKLHVERGETVAMNQNLLRIGDAGRLRIEAEVDEADMGRVRLGMPAAVRLYAFRDRAIRAHVSRISPAADRERKSFSVHFDFDDKVEGLRPGMTAEVNVIIRRKEAVLLCPIEALRDGVAWVVDTEGRLSERKVELGIRDVTRAEVVSGLADGERVVLGVKGAPQTGRRVAPTEVPTSPSAGQGSGAGLAANVK